jgi:hypothetical protein
MAYVPAANETRCFRVRSSSADDYTATLPSDKKAVLSQEEKRNDEMT